MIAGDIPFHHDHEICSGKIQWKNSISEDCRDLIEKCLILDPKKRYSLKEVLQHKWTQGPTRRLGSADLSMTKRPLNGIKTTNPEEQDLEIMKMATLNPCPPLNADEIYQLEQEKHKHPQHIHPHQKPTIVTPEPTSTTIVHESSPQLTNGDKLDRPNCSQSAKRAHEASESGDEENEEKRIEKIRAKAEALFVNNNADVSCWCRNDASETVNDDTQNNNADLLSPSQRKAPGFYYQTNKSDQNLPSAVLYDGAPTISLQHPCSSGKNPSWNGTLF